MYSGTVSMHKKRQAEFPKPLLETGVKKSWVRFYCAAMMCSYWPYTTGIPAVQAAVCFLENVTTN